MSKFTLGNKLRDVVSGFEGIAVSRVQYLNGCVQYCLQAPVKDGARPSGEYVDENQLEFVEAGVSVPAPGTGGPSRDTPSPTYRG